MEKRQIWPRLLGICLLLALTVQAALACGGSSSGAPEVRIHTPTPPPSLEALTPTATAAVAEIPPPTSRSEWAWPSWDADGVNTGSVPVEVPEPPQSGSAAGWSVRMPSIGVDAAVASFGVSADGVMEVPWDAVTVAWYDFTAVPGQPGNAVLAAHVDWAGELGVFNRLKDLVPGALVTLDDPDGGSVTYQVRSVELVDPATADVAALIGSRTGESTLTLITCGGDFNRQTRDYERRVVVRAVQMEAPDAAQS